MPVQRTISPANYLTPTDKEIVDAINQTLGPDPYGRASNKGVDLHNVPNALIRDIANLAAGGSIVEPSDLIENVYEDVKKRKTASQQVSWGSAIGSVNYAYINKRGESTQRTTDNLSLAIKREFNRQVQYHQNAVKFLEEIDHNLLPGRTPLGKSLGLISMMHKSADKSYDGSTRERTIDQDENLQAFDPSKPPDEKLKRGKFVRGDRKSTKISASEINDALSGSGKMADMSAAEQQLLSAASGFKPESISYSDDSDDKKEFKETGDFAIEDLQRVEVARGILDNAKIWTEISGSLDKLSNMAVRKRKSFTADPEGTEFRTRKMKSMGDLTNISQSEWTLPDDYLEYRIVTSKASIRERGKFVDKQQLLYLMIDSSGSMRHNDNISKACGILFNRLKAVVEGNAQVYFRFFDTHLSDEYFAHDEETAKEAMRTISKHGFSGGGTHIVESARTCLDRIRDIMESKEHDLAVPELIIVSDGIDNVSELSASEFMSVGTKLHTLILGYENKEMVDLARQTGGVGIGNL